MMGLGGDARAGNALLLSVPSNTRLQPVASERL